MEQAVSVPSAVAEPSKSVRIWMDGAFDMMHFGHMNAFRLGKALGTIIATAYREAELLCETSITAMLSSTECI